MARSSTGAVLYDKGCGVAPTIQLARVATTNEALVGRAIETMPPCRTPASSYTWANWVAWVQSSLKVSVRSRSVTAG
jgi:hypothetical protein